MCSYGGYHGITESLKKAQHGKIENCRRLGLIVNLFWKQRDPSEALITTKITRE
jgi:hypothetical protein